MSFLFLPDRLLGVASWIWVYLLFSLIMLLVVVVYFNRERLRKTYYTTRYPDRVIRVIIHYPTGYYNVYYRLIPSDNKFHLQDVEYIYNSEYVIREPEMFEKTLDKSLADEPPVPKPSAGLNINIEGVSYDYDPRELIYTRERKYVEIHYFYNVPAPIRFEYDTSTLRINSEQIALLTRADLFNQLINAQATGKMLMILMLAIIANVLISIFIAAKLMGWLE